MTDAERLSGYVDVWWRAVDDFTQLLESVPVAQWSTPTDLPGWDEQGHVASRAYGDAWYDARKAAALIVPSVPAMGYERNLLLNQLHPAFGEITSSRPRQVVWDARLFATAG